MLIKLKKSLPILFMALFAAQSAPAQAVACPKSLKWTDATYVQRSITTAGHIFKADIELFSNATVSHLDAEGVPGALIKLHGKDYPHGIGLTFGTGRPKPLEFAELSMVVEPPMTDGSWPRLSGPCSVKNGVLVHFDETDIAPSVRNPATPPKFHGTLKRIGLGISYSMVVENGADSDRGEEKWQGTWRYEREPRSLSLDTDVQGWHVYRDNTYIKTLPIGIPIPLGSVLNREESRKH